MAAARTTQIRLTSAVTVLSAADPVRVFQQFATLDLIAQGRIEMVVGRGSFTESFPLFGLNLPDYNKLFEEKLDLLLRLRDEEHVRWSGKHRPALTGQGVYPRPMQTQLPIWLGVGGTPESFVRAGTLGLPLVVAVIGGETHLRYGLLHGACIRHVKGVHAHGGQVSDLVSAGLRMVAATCQPRSAKRRTAAAPIPVEVPVMKTV